MSTVPQEFGENFLEWLRQTTEQSWAKQASPTFKDYVDAGVGGAGWQKGTRWLGGLSESEISAVEAMNGFRFPPDHRLFLRHLHATDRPMVGARFVGSSLEPFEKPGFYNWMSDTEAIRGAIEGVFEGLLFDVEMNNLWPTIWGPRPRSKQERKAALRTQLDNAPPLIPLFGHRFVLGVTELPVNPVVSVHQSDMIIYGVDLRDYLLTELRELIAVPGDSGEPNQFDYAQIPFWGYFLG